MAVRRRSECVTSAPTCGPSVPILRPRGVVDGDISEDPVDSTAATSSHRCSLRSCRHIWNVCCRPSAFSPLPRLVLAGLFNYFPMKDGDDCLSGSCGPPICNILYFLPIR